jgi:hypothetical protein
VNDVPTVAPPPAVAPALDAAERSRITFRQDRIRGACMGLLETGASTFGLVVAIRYFEATATLKAAVSSASAVGLLLTPFSLFLFARAGWTAARAAAWNFAIGGLMIVAAALAPSLWLFVPTLGIASILLAQQAPLLVHLYTLNYAPGRRGRMLSNSIVLSLITAIAFSALGGRALDWRLESFRGLFGLMALAALGAGWAVARIPAEPFSREGGRNPLAAMRYVWRDPVFGWMLLVWMLMGLGNLMTLPVRVEYMANPAYGINATNAQIAIVTAVIPSIARLATTHAWGILFDRYNFFIIRTVLNGCFLVAILVFFASRQLWLLWVAAAMFGFAMAGGNIAWNLWVTKFAPPERASEYMSIHTFLTGARGVVAPFLGFWTIAQFSALTTAFIAAGLIALSMVLLDPIRRRHGDLGPRSHKPAAG